MRKQPPSVDEVRKISGAGYLWFTEPRHGGDWYVAGPVWAVNKLMGRELVGREPRMRCPYGVPGDRLWVRETFAVNDAGELTTYMADKNGLGWMLREGLIRPSIFMRRKNSRLTLEVVSVTVEQLHDITEEDAVREGVADTSAIWDGVPGERGGPREAFRVLWDRINDSRALWSSNPWVWRIEFKRIEEVR